MEGGLRCCSTSPRPQAQARDASSSSASLTTMTASSWHRSLISWPARLLLCAAAVHSWAPLPLPQQRGAFPSWRRLTNASPPKAEVPALYSSPSSPDDAEDDASSIAAASSSSSAVDRTTFDQAGASLIEEEDRQRMEQMGDFDANPAYQSDNIERMRAAIRAKTAQLGLEKSKASAAYIESRRERAVQAGPPGQSSDPDTFAGLDLSKISSSRDSSSSSSSQWNEDLPSMFYDPEDELTQEEMEEVDPIMKQSAVEQGLNELRNAQWPTLGSAFREVLLMLAVVALSAVLIIGWDKALRELYTAVGFIPTKEDIANYASRFDGLDLPKGWTDNMSEQDVSQFAGAVNSANANLPPMTLPTAGLPEL